MTQGRPAHPKLCCVSWMSYLHGLKSQELRLQLLWLLCSRWSSQFLHLQMPAFRDWLAVSMRNSRYSGRHITVLLPLFSRKARRCSKRNHIKNCKGKGSMEGSGSGGIWTGIYQTHRETIGVTRQGLGQHGFVQVLQLNIGLLGGRLEERRGRVITPWVEVENKDFPLDWDNGANFNLRDSWMEEIGHGKLY